jgi:hypothetical protein
MSQIERDLKSWVYFSTALRCPIQTASGAHQAYKPVNTGALSTGVKRPESEADNSSPSRTDVKNVWGDISIGRKSSWSAA